MSKIFLPFVRKSMAETLVWDNKLSVMDNFSKSIQLNPDDTGYGKFNEFTGELEKAREDGKATFTVDGKTYKVKEALSKLIDKQKI